MDGEQDFILPSLAPNLKITRAPEAGGEPYWTLHHPAANTYFKIDWITFEALSRFSTHRTAQDLKAAIESQTTIKITLEQISEIVFFFAQKCAYRIKRPAGARR